MYNPEAKLAADLTLEQAYRQAERTLKAEEIDLGDFADLYGEENIARDRAEVERLEREFERAKTPETERLLRLSRTFEAIFHEQAELSEWLGPDASTIKASRFDDLKNGIDSIAELRAEDRSATHLALAIDVTFSQDLTKKFDRIKQEISEGAFPRVKYFSSGELGFRGELSNIPRVVIGADARTVRALAELWLEGKKSLLGTHPVQFQVLEEVIDQLETFAQYAERVGKRDFADICRRNAALVRDIQRTKRTEIEDTGERDSVSEAIHQELRSF